VERTFESNVSPNTSNVSYRNSSNSKTSLYYFKMVPLDKATTFLLRQLVAENRKRCRVWEKGYAIIVQRRQLMLKAIFMAVILVLSNDQSRRHHINRSVRWLNRNTGCWQTVWTGYDNKRFKDTFRISRKTFTFILSRIRHKLEKKIVCEDPISLEFRLAICLYRLGRGDYMYSIAEMVGLGCSTVTTIVNEVIEAILFYLSSVLEGSKVAYHGSPLFSTLRLPFQLPILSNVGPFLDVINPHSPRSSL